MSEQFTNAPERSENLGIGLVEWFRINDKAHVEKVINDLKILNIKHIRTGISWADYYTPGAEDWYKWLIPTLAKEVQVLPCFLYTPPSLGIEPKTSSPPVNLKHFADFMDVIITELGDYFEWVELWNEPNNKLEYDFTMDNHWFKFAEMVGGAAYWAKQRGKKTVLGGMSPVDPNWLQLMFERGVMQYIDAVGIHGFPDVFDQLWEGWEKTINKVRAILSENNSKAEIWITEAGFSTWQFDEYKQVEEFKKVIKVPVSRIFWYGGYDLNPNLPTIGGFHIDEREYFFGLKKEDGSPKLLYRLIEENGIENLDKLEYFTKSINYVKNKPYSLITGGAGFIGTNTAKRLINEGKRVMILDNLSRQGVEKNLKWLYENHKDKIEIQIVDIRNAMAVEKAVVKADEIFHFAAQVAVTTSIDNPIRDFDINARGTVNVLEALKKLKSPPPLVYTSTNKVYGALDDLKFHANDTRYHPSSNMIKANGISEARPVYFHSPYGCSKGAADQYVSDYARTFNIPAVVFRMSCIYGPYQYGNEDQGWVAHFLIKAIENQQIRLFGNGKQVRDILFVEDLVDALFLAQKNIKEISGQAFNIGGGTRNTTSLLELIAIIEEIQGKKIDIEWGDSRPGDQLYYVSNIKKFNEATGWYPKYNVAEGVTALFKWLCTARGITPQVNLMNLSQEAVL